LLADQSVFDENDIEGVVVGFCFPAHAGRLNLPGRHLHFLSSDRTRGGHVLSCRPAECVVRVDHEAEIEVELPLGVELKVHADGGPEDPGDSDGLLRLERD
jgi:acetolactate decarboxylase